MENERNINPYEQIYERAKRIIEAYEIVNDKLRVKNILLSDLSDDEKETAINSLEEERNAALFYLANVDIHEKVVAIDYNGTKHILRR